MKLSSSSLFKSTALAATFVLAGMPAAQAATVTITTETGMAMRTQFGIRADTGTRGYELAGASVTATFADGTTETATWADANSMSAGGAGGDRWSLFQNAFGFVSLDVDPMADPMDPNARRMTSFSIDASTSQSVTPNFADPSQPDFVQGPSLFDISMQDESQGDTGSTPGSSFGFPFRFTFGAPVGDVAVNYSGAVNILGQDAVGDLFTTMTVDFTGLLGGGFTGSAVYESDQDTLRFAGDLAPVPLPAGLPLLVLGLGALGVARRRK
jgi:hypothetical protein